MQSVPIELVLSIIEHVDAKTALDMAISDIKGGFFSFIVNEDSYWDRSIQKDYPEFPIEFDLPVHFLVRDKIIDSIENRPFYRYLFLSHFSHNIASFRCCKYLEDKSLLITENTFQAQFHSEAHKEIFGDIEEPILKGKIVRDGTKFTVYTSMFFEKIGITLKMRLNNYWAQDGRILFHATLINDQLGPKFPLVFSGKDGFPLNRLRYIENYISLQAPQTITKSPFYGDAFFFLEALLPVKTTENQLRGRVSKLAMDYFVLFNEVVRQTKSS